MAVLVTGAGGYIGGHIGRTLLEGGEQVVGFDVAPPPSHSVLYPLLGEFPFVPGSILDLALLLNVIKQHKIDNVLHLAAIMGGARDRPVETVRVNVEGTVHVLEAGRLMGLRRVICTSSFSAAGAAGKDQSRLIPETEYSLPVTDGVPPYPATKLMCEEMTYVYRNEYGVDAAIIRPARVYGPGRAPARAGGIPIEVLLGKAFASESVSVARGRDTRIDLTYVKDQVQGFLRALRAPTLPNWLYNISAGRVYAIGEIAAAIGRSFPKVSMEIGPGEWRGLTGDGPGETVRAAADISRAREDLGYEPQFADLDNAIVDYRQWVEARKY